MCVQPVQATLEGWLAASDATLELALAACLTAAPPFTAVPQVRARYPQ